MSIEFADAAKARQLREYFARHGRIYIVVNATRDDVRVPPHLHGDPALRLVLNVRMPQPILIKDDVLESDFSFSGTPFHCVIPMQAIWAAYVPEQDIAGGIVWDADVPETIRAVLMAARDISAGREDGEAETSAREQEPDKPDDEAAPAGRRVGHLRVVK